MTPSTGDAQHHIPMARSVLFHSAIRGVIVGLVIKIIITSIILLSFYLSSDFENVINLWNRWYTGPEDLSSWYIPFANWDGQYYLLLSDWGYNYAGTIDSPSAFFPLYPMLIRILSMVLPNMVAAALLSVLTTAGFCYFLFLIGTHTGCKKPHLAVLFLLSFPTAFYTSVFYTEGLFLFLLLGFVYHYFFFQSRTAWVYAALLPLTRGAALFVVAGVVANMLLGYLRSVRQGTQLTPGNANIHSGTDRRAPTGESVAEIAFDWNYHARCGVAFLVGGMLYLAFFGVAAGDPLAGVAGQDTFAVNSISNLLNPSHFLSYLLSDSTSWFGARDSLFNKISVITAILGSVVFVIGREWRLLCFYLPLVYGHAAMGIGVSFPRFWLAAVPFLGLALARNVKQSWILYTVCAAMLGLQLFLLHKFSLNLWVA
jgi:hypothetical protein